MRRLVDVPLPRRPAERRVRRGVNVFDVGFAGYYRNAEANLAPFVGKVCVTRSS
jgi:hypothetical protein